MAARAIWKGRIRFGSVDVPVKLYSAVQDRAVHFRLLDARAQAPVEQQMVDPDTGAVVPAEGVRKAFQTEEGEMVILSAEELEELQPPESREIEVTRFVPPEEITHAWYERPYYLGPDGDEEGYFALQAALEREGKEGVCRWTMRKKEYVGALRAQDGYLVLIALRSAGEVVPASALPAPGGRELDARELAMAKQLVAAMEDELDFAAYRDEYRERVMALVEAKAAGTMVKFPKAPEREKETSLADVLERSLAATKERRRA